MRGAASQTGMVVVGARVNGAESTRGRASSAALPRARRHERPRRARPPERWLQAVRRAAGQVRGERVGDEIAATARAAARARPRARDADDARADRARRLRGRAVV